MRKLVLLLVVLASLATVGSAQSSLRLGSPNWNDYAPVSPSWCTSSTPTPTPR